MLLQTDSFPFLRLSVSLSLFQTAHFSFMLSYFQLSTPTGNQNLNFDSTQKYLPHFQWPSGLCNKKKKKTLNININIILFLYKALALCEILTFPNLTPAHCPSTFQRSLQRHFAFYFPEIHLISTSLSRYRLKTAINPERTRVCGREKPFFNRPTGRLAALELSCSCTFTRLVAVPFPIMEISLYIPCGRGRVW